MAESLQIAEGSKTEQYEALLPQIASLIEGENDEIANMANVAAAIMETFHFWWVGFYRVKENQLVLSPFQGPLACTRIGFGKGVCGTAWKEARTILVPDVETFPGHIACSSASRSEIVVPLFRRGEVYAVLDIDSEHLNTFDETDAHYLERIGKILSGENRMTIRKASPGDLDRLMEIFDIARRFMQSTGNANQWINGYPQRELIAREIEASHCHVCENETGQIVGTFCFIPGPDPTYSYIEDGAWPNDEPYYVIHRIASDGSCKGIAKACIDWCYSQCQHLRVDTHADNEVMQKSLIRNGFVRCGIIYVANGTPRIAFQRD